VQPIHSPEAGGGEDVDRGAERDQLLGGGRRVVRQRSVQHVVRVHIELRAVLEQYVDERT
jgi:hypothetical protein